MQPSQKTDNATASAHVQGVNTTAGGLIKATLGAAVVAGAILTFLWLPAEHGIDPTGVGHVLGLTEMGHIKEQLHLEADADAADAADAKAEQMAAQITDEKGKEMAAQAQSDANITQKLDAIQTQLTAIATTVGASSSTNSELPATSADAENITKTPSLWLHEDNYTLAPNKGIEVKLVMDEGSVAEFEWTANGSAVYHDTHGDGLDKSISYKKGRSVPEESGQLTAAFDGNHGWYWRNRTEDEVVITLRTRGDYKGILPP